MRSFLPRFAVMSSKAAQACECESCHSPLALCPDCLPSGQSLDLIEQESDPPPGLLLSCSLHSGGWSAFLSKTAPRTAFRSRHSEASTHTAYKDAMKIKCVLFISPRAPPPTSQRKKKLQAENANNFSNRSFYENACFYSIFFKDYRIT